MNKHSENINESPMLSQVEQSDKSLSNFHSFNKNKKNSNSNRLNPSMADSPLENEKNANAFLNEISNTP